MNYTFSGSNDELIDRLNDIKEGDREGKDHDKSSTKDQSISITAKVIEIQQEFPEKGHGAKARCQLLDGGYEGFVISTTVDETTKEGDQIQIAQEEEYDIADDWSDITANGVDPTTFELIGADFTRSNLRDANFSSSDLSHSSFREADLSNANLSHTSLVEVKLTNADLSSADLSDADLKGANLTDAKLANADLTNANLKGSVMDGANISGAKLDQTDLRDVDLSGVNVASAKLNNIDYLDLSRSLINSKGILDKSKGVDVAEIIIQENPEYARNLVDPLAELLTKIEIPSVQISILRALKTANDNTVVSLSKFDDIFASILRDGSESVREVLVIELSPILIEEPCEYPKSISALQKIVEGGYSEVQPYAAKSLAVILFDSPSEISDIDTLEESFRSLSEHPGVTEEEMNELIGIVASTKTGGAGG
ncbi:MULTISPECIES: pentapeptide repeat-containing protein [unclassified Haloarcula]|uniref:pentapeptide repeat-containing protein n=1 Tax=unclassified Haloarcula TaxID=2624677 RepID=UPI001E4623B9|nr:MULTISPECIES: pentapeptide repeat-containing protein [unclassified Haloarcula]